MFKDELILIRHARSKYNVRQSNDLDSPITEFGHKQAKTVASFIKKHMGVDPEHFTFYTSPFLRCLQTMQYFKEAFSLKDYRVYVKPQLREYINHSGREAIVPVRSADYLFDWCCPPSDLVFKDETNEEFYTRMLNVYNELSSKSIVVTHGLPLLLLKHIATENTRVIPLWDHNLDNCSITYIVNGRVVWYGRNLHCELEEDVYDTPKPYDFLELKR